MSDSEHEYIGPRCCPCCNHRSGAPYVPHDRHECHPGPQWSWMSHKSDPTEEHGRVFCSCSKVLAGLKT